MQIFIYKYHYIIGHRIPCALYYPGKEKKTGKKEKRKERADKIIGRYVLQESIKPCITIPYPLVISVTVNKLKITLYKPHLFIIKLQTN